MKFSDALLTTLVIARPGAAGLVNDLFAGKSPQIKLDYAAFKGVADFRTGTNNFLGMPFAVASRLSNPRVIGAQDKLKGLQDATKYGAACPQQEFIASPLYAGNSEIGGLLATIEQLTIQNLTNQAEDCLNLNVQVPKRVKSPKKLPVVLWIHGGGFELGSSAALGSEQTALPGVIYQGANIVARSVEMNQPIIFVSANHRLNAFGTLASQETTDADVGNLLLKDQRIAMKWIQKYIGKFGGDPEKVTLFGESAGSIAVGTHMVLNDGNPEGLFRGAVMFSGTASKYLDYKRGQQTFDTMMEYIGCDTAKNKIDCFRKADYEAIYKAVQKYPIFLSYYSTLVPWYPRPDGKYLVDSPDTLLRKGIISKTPYIIGDMRDEGTIFSLVTQLNITNDEEFQRYFKTVFFPRVSDATMEKLAAHYPEDPAAGSPFGTGQENAFTPQYKRLAALIGDYTFQAPRRQLLKYTEGRQDQWTYQTRDSIPILGKSALLSGLDVTNLPAVGSFHVSDVVFYAFGTIPTNLSKNSLHIMSTLVSFVNHLDPNHHGLEDLPHWPKWNSETKSMLLYAEDGCKIMKDDYRMAAMDFINNNPYELSY